MWFSKKKSLDVTDVIFLNQNGFVKAITGWLQQNVSGAVAVWFQRDLDELRTRVPGIAPDRFVLADRLSFSAGDGKPLIFAGHYPLHQVETDLYDRLGLNGVTVYAHMEMPLLQYFGGSRITEIMIKMGMNEDDPLNHALITKAIGTAQEKIAKECITDMRASSEEEWIRMNVLNR